MDLNIRDLPILVFFGDSSATHVMKQPLDSLVIFLWHILTKLNYPANCTKLNVEKCRLLKPTELWRVFHQMLPTENVRRLDGFSTFSLLHRSIVLLSWCWSGQFLKRFHNNGRWRSIKIFLTWRWSISHFCLFPELGSHGRRKGLRFLDASSTPSLLSFMKFLLKSGFPPCGAIRTSDIGCTVTLWSCFWNHLEPLARCNRRCCCWGSILCSCRCWTGGRGTINLLNLPTWFRKKISHQFCHFRVFAVFKALLPDCHVVFLDVRKVLPPLLGILALLFQQEDQVPGCCRGQCMTETIPLLESRDCLQQQHFSLF